MYTRSYSLSQYLRNVPPEEPMAAYWDDMKLHAIHPYWLTVNSSNLHLLDLHGNKLTDLPADFFSYLPVLEDLDLSCNRLQTLPSIGLEFSR